MNNRNRDLLLLLKATSFKEADFEKHVEALHMVLVQVECDDTFCQAHELATRMNITQKKKKILKAAASADLRPFYFLINKN
jgi:hypothetical protein